MPARNKGSHWGHSIRVLVVASAAVARRLHQSSCRAQGLTSPHRSRHRRHYSSNHRNNCTRLPQVPQIRRATLLVPVVPGLRPRDRLNVREGSSASTARRSPSARSRCAIRPMRRRRALTSQTCRHLHRCGASIDQPCSNACRGAVLIPRLLS